MQIKKIIESLEAIPGDIAECGTYRGGTTAVIALQLKKVSSKKKLHSFDSFQGSPKPTMEDTGNLTNNFAHLRVFSHTSEKLVSNKLRRLQIAGYVHIYKGFFHDTLPSLMADSLSLVFLDCSLYDSYRRCLNHLYPIVSPGGILLFDDYGSSTYPGGKRAIDQFFTDKPEKPQKIGFFWSVKKGPV